MQDTVDALGAAEQNIDQLVRENDELRARLDLQTSQFKVQQTAVFEEMSDEKEVCVCLLLRMVGCDVADRVMSRLQALREENTRLQAMISMCEERLTQVAVSERQAREDAEASRAALAKV